MKKLLNIIMVMLWPLCLWAETPDELPKPDGLVADFAQLLTVEQKAFLEDSLLRFERRTSTQILVLTVKSLDGYDRADFAYRVGEKWGVGQKGKNNGVVILVKPKSDKERGEAFIATGYGLEGVLPDVVCSRIVNEQMIPYFKQNNYADGVVAGAIAVMLRADGEYEADGVAEDGSSLGFFLLVLLVFFIIIYINKDNHHNGGGHISSGPIIMGGASSDWGSFRSGSGSFGGFGGGSFGGGGGGGSW